MHVYCIRNKYRDVKVKGAWALYDVGVALFYFKANAVSLDEVSIKFVKVIAPAIIPLLSVD